MEIFFTYLFKSSLLIALFWCCSQFFLQRETFFQQHRLFLFFGLFTALLFPFITITKVIYVQPILSTIPLENIAEASTITDGNYINWWTVLLVIYLVGSSILFIHFCIQLFSLRKLIKNSTNFKKGSFRFVETSDNISPFSFFNYIVYNPSLYTSQELETILAHEQVHSYQKHSLDIILVHLLRIFQWMNPFIWGYKKMVSQNLEYIADHEVGKTNYNKKEYQYLLLRQSAVPLQFSSLGNPFFNSLIKKRIVMLNKNKSNKGNLLKFSIILPLLAVFLFTLNTKTIAQTITTDYEEESDSNTSSFNSAVTSVTFSLTIDKNSTDEELENEIVQFKKEGIDLKFYGINRNNDGEIIAISSSFKESTGNSGNYSVSGSEPIKSFNFYTKSDGKENIQEIGYSVEASNSHKTHLNQHFDNHETHLKNTGKLDKKAKKHLKEHKKAALHGHVKTEESTVHISNTAFEKTATTVTSNGNSTTEIKGDATTYSSYTQDQEKEPLYIVNGKVIKKADVPNIPTYQIISMSVIKGKYGIAKYGKKGENGVVEITLDTSRTKEDNKDSITTADILKVGKDDGKKPLYIIDGEKMGPDFDLGKIDTNNIKSVFVVKGKKAKKKYGKEGKNGVVVIDMKKKK